MLPEYKCGLNTIRNHQAVTPNDESALALQRTDLCTVRQKAEVHKLLTATDG